MFEAGLILCIGLSGGRNVHFTTCFLAALNSLSRRPILFRAPEL